VLVPPDLHVLVTRRLLSSGIGALVEKPRRCPGGSARPALGQEPADLLQRPGSGREVHRGQAARRPGR
jgi:hypothetical protein